MNLKSIDTKSFRLSHQLPLDVDGLVVDSQQVPNFLLDFRRLDIVLPQHFPESAFPAILQRRADAVRVQELLFHLVRVFQQGSFFLKPVIFFNGGFLAALKLKQRILDWKHLRKQTWSN